MLRVSTRDNSKATKKLFRTTGKSAAFRAAEYVAQVARTYVPVASGRLRKSIKAMKSGRVKAGSKKVYWALWVEFGTARAPAQSFLRRALYKSRAAIKRIMAREYRRQFGVVGRIRRLFSSG